MCHKTGHTPVETLTRSSESLGVAALGRRNVLGRSNALGDGLCDLDLLGCGYTRWSGGLGATVAILTPCPLVNGLSEGQTSSDSFSVGQTSVLVLLDLLLIVNLSGTLLNKVSLVLGACGDSGCGGDGACDLGGGDGC